MTTLREVHEIALALPEAVEQDHHGIPSFRVRGKIFATVPDGAHVRIMVDADGIEEAVAAFPAACAPLLWGRRPAGVTVTLHAADRRLLEELLEDAWRRRAPAALVRARDAARPSTG